MKLVSCVFIVAGMCTLFAANAAADGLVRLASSEAYYVNQEETAPSPSDIVPPPDLLSDVKEDGCGCEKAVKGGGGLSGLFSGHIAAGVTLNADRPASNYNGPVTFNDRNEIQLNQTYLSFGRDVDNGGCGWGVGGRLDLLYGTDYIFTQAIGLETKDDGQNAWNGSKMYGLAMPQAYVDVAYNDLSLKVGHFYTIMGYEVVDATGNFFYSHAYTMQYGEPFTHTGGLATYDYSDQLILYGGLVNGWDNFDALTDKLAFLGGATWSPRGRDYSLTAMVISGEETGVAPPTTVRTGYSIVFDYDITCHLKYVLQHDNFWQEDVFGPGLDAEWYGINQYLLYTVNDRWALGARFEWFRDDDGVRLNGTHLRETLTGRPAVMTAAAAAGNYYGMTLGANWTPRERLTVRPEVRWDWSDGTAGQPYDGGTKDSQFTAALDAILTF